MPNRNFLLFAVALVFFQACKVSRTTQQTTDPSGDTATVIVPVDTVITVRVQDSVALNVHRVVPDTITIAGVGDIMMGTNFPKDHYLPPNNGRHLFAEVDSILRAAEVTFGNLEGVILDEGGSPKNCKNPKLCFLFRTPEAFVENLVNAGFTVMSTANNHAGDFGEEGRMNTMKVLDSVGIAHAGLLSKPHAMFKVKGMRYGFAAFAPNNGTVSIHDLEGATDIVSELDSLNDIVIVSFHGGAEGKKYQHVTRETEYFYGEDRGNIYEFAHALIDAGADIVFGHGPHVTRAIELYKRRFIAYSLGNFCTFARFNLKGENGIAPIIKIHTDHRGAFLKGMIIPVVQEGQGGPKIDPEGRAIRKIRELTEKDFPEAPLTIEETGIITYIDD